MARRKGKKKGGFKPGQALLKNAVYKAGNRKPSKRARYRAGLSENRAAGEAIKQGQKEAAIRDLMKSEGLTYAQAAIRMME